MTTTDAIIARFMALHPKRIDLSLGRIESLLRAPRPSASAPAARHPRRRHQWQGLDHRLHAGGARGRRPRRPCLYLAASGPFPRAHPSRRPAAAGSSTRRAGGGPRALRGGQCRRADHLLRDHHRRRLRCSSPRRRPTRCCSRWGLAGADATNVIDAPLVSVITSISHRSRRFPGDRHRGDRGREGRHPAGRRRGRAAPPDRPGARPRSNASPTGSARP